MVEKPNTETIVLAMNVFLSRDFVFGIFFAVLCKTILNFKCHIYSAYKLRLFWQNGKKVVSYQMSIKPSQCRVLLCSTKGR